MTMQAEVRRLTKGQRDLLRAIHHQIPRSFHRRVAEPLEAAGLIFWIRRNAVDRLQQLLREPVCSDSGWVGYPVMTAQAAKHGFHTSITASRPRLTIGAALGIAIAVAAVVAVLVGTMPNG